MTTLQIPDDVRQEIVTAWPWAEAILEAVRALAADEPPPDSEATVAFGAELEQASLDAGQPEVAVGD